MIVKCSSGLAGFLVTGSSESFPSMTSLRFQWTYANKAGSDLLTIYKSGDVAKNYIKYTPPFVSTQKRITVFSEDLTAPESNKKTLQTIYSNKNNSSKSNPYNFKRKFKGKIKIMGIGRYNINLKFFFWLIK